MSGAATASSVPRVPPPPPSAFRAIYADASRPVVLAGAASRMPAVGRWDHDHFVRHHGDLEIDVQRYERSAMVDVVFETMPLRRYVAHLRSGSRAYHFSGHGPFARVPSLISELGIPGYVERLGHDQPWLFLSPRDAVTPLHQDLCHNLYVQLSGKKRFVLFPPEQRALLHAPSRLSRTWWTSPVDVDALDDPRTPRARHATPTIAELEPGDMLFIPGGHWHSVRTLEESVAVAFFWEHGAAQHLLRALLRMIGRPTT